MRRCVEVAARSACPTAPWLCLRYLGIAVARKVHQVNRSLVDIVKVDSLGLSRLCRTVRARDFPVHQRVDHGRFSHVGFSGEGHLHACSFFGSGLVMPQTVSRCHIFYNHNHVLSQFLDIHCDRFQRLHPYGSFTKRISRPFLISEEISATSGRFFSGTRTSADARVLRCQKLFLEAADGKDSSPQRDLSGHGDIRPYRTLR